MGKVNSIKKGCLFFLLFVFSVGLSAQTPHFLYIQSDNSQAFYVRLNNKIFSSSQLGYLIMPKLQPGKLSLIIGFPMNKWNAMNYNIDIEDKDLSFQLKKVDSLEWELYDNQEKHTVFRNKTNQQQELMENNNDEFSNILAEVSNNPKIKQTKKIIQTKDSSNLKLETNVKVVENVDSNLANADIAQIEKENDKKLERKMDKQRIQKDFSFIDSTGNLIKYVITEVDKSDTVSIFIPFPKGIKNDTSRSQQIIIAENALKEKVSIATENDFLQLRKQMILEENEERMISISEKAFEQLAYSTDMIKNLSVLFLKEKNKLTFLLNAYKYVSDKQNYRLLSTVLSEEKSLIQFNQLFE